MGLDIDIYKRNLNLKHNTEEVGCWLYELRNAHDLIDYLLELDNSNYFNKLGFAIFRLDKERISNLNDWLVKNSSENWNYDCILEKTEKESDLFVYANW